MQKVYSRINWENDPSTNTPLSEDNLNKMDYALDKIDDRVVQLGGYQDRVAQSEKNAKTSETNAKASETNAKQSEVKAKQYMENAFSGTPEGYAALVEQVGLLDIMKSTAYTYPNTKPGGLRLLELVGATVQNGEPSTDNLIVIENVGDCVEMVQGGIIESNGALDPNAWQKVLCKRPIPCKTGDIIVVNNQLSSDYACAFYNGNTFISYKNASINQPITAPNGVTHFKFFVYCYGGITPQTVGKISLTVNGKHVVQFVEHGKNLFDYVTHLANNNRSIISVKGGQTLYRSGVGYTSLWKLYDVNGNLLGDFTTLNFKSNTPFVLPTNASYIVTTDHADNTDTLSTFYLGYSSDISFEPYTEKVATIFLDEPLREGDRLVKVDGVIYEGHKKASVLAKNCVNLGFSDVVNNRGAIKLPQKALDTSLWGENNITALCTHFNYEATVYNDTADSMGFFIMNNICYFRFTSASDINSPTLFTEWIDTNNPIIEYPLAEETLTPLDHQSQIALNGLETFKDMTYLEVDSKIKPSGIEVEYGTSQVGAYTLKCMNDNDTDKIERAKLMDMILSLGGNA